MDGITILNQTKEFYGIVNPFWIFLPFCIAVICFAIGIILFENYEDVATVFFLGTIVALISTAIVAIISALPSNEVKQINYEVTINDSVSFNDFTDKYEIIDRHGEIYIVTERKGDK
jgi:uncharacterized membrane protein